eukprot:21539-Heterococcus_DN1.PRE.6
MVAHNAHVNGGRTSSSASGGLCASICARCISELRLLRSMTVHRLASLRKLTSSSSLCKPETARAAAAHIQFMCSAGLHQ